MSDKNKFLKQYASQYYFYYTMAFVVLLPIWLQLLGISLYRDINAIISFVFMFLGIMLVSLAATFRHLKPQFKISKRLLLFVGLSVQLLCLFMIYKTVPIYYVLNVFVLVSILMSTFWLVMYFIDLPELDIEKTRLIGKKVIKYLVLSVLLLYGFNFIVGRYYSQIIFKIIELPIKPEFVGSKMHYAEIESQLHSKLLEARLLILFITIISLVLFFVFYKKVTKEVNQGAEKTVQA